MHMKHHKFTGIHISPNTPPQCVTVRGDIWIFMNLCGLAMIYMQFYMSICIFDIFKPLCAQSACRRRFFPGNKWCS